ncbi:MAG: hypothetical protein M1839_000729 [Geoglossum umbratile]|nr:MAG: hypothetical protein M1839_000729 [Geoglossum umbratile]
METHSKPPTTPSRRERSHSFSLFGSMLGKRRSPHSGVLEPIEVAPGIMSTDATAIVFELDPRRTKSSKQKNRRVDGDEKGMTGSGLPVWRTIRAAHEDDGTDDFSKHPARVATTSYFEKRDRRREEARVNHLRAEEQTARGRRARMRDSADYLTVRFVNPATGLVSPSVVSDTTAPSPPETSGYIGGERLLSREAEKQRNERDIEELRRQQGDIIRTRSSRWNVAQTPILSPVPQSSGTTSPARRGASNPTVAPGDRFVLHMPSAQEPCPFEYPGKTSEQILAYQQGVEAARRRASGGLVDPSTPPSPRPTSPNEQHSTRSCPDARPAMIPRKPVGSPVSRRSESDGTVIVDSSRRSASVPTPNRNPNQPVIKVTSPEQVTRNLSSTSGQTTSRYHSQSQQPFLGGQADGGFFEPPHPLTPSLEEIHYRSRQDIEPHHRPSYHLPSQLPEVSITHPDLASIPTSQRPRGIKGLVPRSLQGAFTTTIPTTTTTTTGSLRRIEVPQERSDVSLPPSASRRGHPGVTPEQPGPQMHHGGSLPAPQVQNGGRPVQRSSFLHPPRLVLGQRARGSPPSTRTSTSMSPQTSPQGQHWTVERPLHRTYQNDRLPRGGSLGSSVRDLASTRASVVTGGHRGMDTDGAHEAPNNASDPRGLRETARKRSVVDRRTASVETRSSSSSNGGTSSVASDDQLTGWRGVGRWGPPLTPEEEEARKREHNGSETRAQTPKEPAPTTTNKPEEPTPPPNTNPSWPPWSATLLPRNSRLLTTLLAMLRHIQTVCTPWSHTNQLLTSPEARVGDYVVVARAWLLAGIYVGVFVYLGLVVVGLMGVLREVGRCLALRGVVGR